MWSVREATLDGLNQYLAEQRDKPDFHLTLLQFDNDAMDLDITETFKDILAPDTPTLTLDDYEPRGSTPLYPAIVYGIAELERQSNPGDKIVMVIQTDGQNTSNDPEITLESTKLAIKAREDKGNWTFVFLGADVAAWDSGSAIGFKTGSTLNYQNTYAGTVTTYNAASTATTDWYNDTKHLSTANFFGNGPKTLTEEELDKIVPTSGGGL